MSTTKKGITGKDEKQNDIIIFLEATGFMAYYPAFLSSLDILSRNAAFPYICSIFKRRRKVAGSDYSYTVWIKSRRHAYIWTSLKTISIRSDFVAGNIGKSTSLLVGPVNELKTSPLFELHFKLKASSCSIPKRLNNLLVTSTDFDSYPSLGIVTDKALMRLERNVIDVFFQLLSSN